MKKYEVSIGSQGSADSTFKINDKEYGIESRAWNLIAFAQAGSVTLDNIGNYLEYIYDNFDEDLINSEPVRKSGAKHPEVCSLKTGEDTCTCAHYCTRHGDQIDSIFV